MQTNQLTALLPNLNKLTVLILGEAILDSYLMGDTERLCREAPAPVVDIRQRHEMPGGAAHTATNVATLGGNAIFLSVVGTDVAADTLRSQLTQRGVNTEEMIVDSDYQTLVKQRITAREQIVVRCDQGSVDPITGILEQRLIDRLEALAPQCDVILVSDYNYGILTPSLIEALVRLRPDFAGVLAVDSKRLSHFRACRPTLVKPSYQQALDLLGVETRRNGTRREQIVDYQQQLLACTGAEIVAVTLDADGSVIFLENQEPYYTYTRPADHANAVGAGDTYISAFALALTAGASTRQAADLAANAGQVVVQEPGTTPCTREALLAHLNARPAKNTKRIEAADLPIHVERYRQQQKRIVFTNGCFDILHAGHVQYLAQARALGDVLIVGVNSDASVSRRKGPERPVNALSERMAVLAALESVDLVVAFEDDTPVNLIKVVCPDVFVKGGDYSEETLPEAPLVRQLGGRVEIMPYVMNRSTTQIIDRIRHTHPQRNGKSGIATYPYTTLWDKPQASSGGH